MLVRSKWTHPVGGWKYGFGTGGDGVVEITVWRDGGRTLECKAIQGKLREHWCLKKKQIWGEGRVRWQRDQENRLQPPFPAGSATPGHPAPRLRLAALCPLLFTPALLRRAVCPGRRLLGLPSLLTSRIRVCFSPLFSDADQDSPLDLC